MPFALVFGVTIFGEYPDRIALVGIALIVASGLILIWREAVSQRNHRAKDTSRL